MARSGAGVTDGAQSQTTPAGSPAAGATTSDPAATTPADAPEAVAALRRPWSAPAESHSLLEATSSDGGSLGGGLVFLSLGFAATFAFAAVLAKRRLVPARSLSES